MCKKYDRYGQMVADKKYFVNIVNLLGLRENYTGYYYSVDILDLLINQHINVTSFSRQVYPTIAEKYHKNVCTVERNIRNLIAKSWSDEMYEKLKKFLKTNKKPRCRQFLMAIKDYIMEQIFK